MPDQKTMPLLPRITTIEQMNKMEKLVVERNNADYRCYQLLRQMLEEDLYDQTGVVFEEFMLEAKEAVEHRKVTNNQLLELMATGSTK